jgi:hypothetical protein
MDPAADTLNFAKCHFKSRSHFLPRHVPRGEYKFSHGVLLERTFFKEIVTDSLVRSKQHPPVAPHMRQPDFVCRSTRKVIEMTLEPNAQLGQRLMNGHGVAEILVEI